jgi:hypothetical protein
MWPTSYLNFSRNSLVIVAAECRMTTIVCLTAGEYQPRISFQK